MGNSVQPLRYVGIVFLVLLSTQLTERVAAQCTLLWQDVPVSYDTASGAPVGTTVNGGCMWDPDGPGPATPLFAFCGVLMGNLSLGTPFPITTHAKTVAAYDPVSGIWQLVGTGDGYTTVSTQAMPFPTGAITEAFAVCAASNGDLFVGGAQYNSSVTYSGYVHHWDGANWNGIGNADGFVNAVLCMPGGDLIVGGSFTQIGGVAANGIARWDGLGWSPLGAGVNASVASLEILPGGDLVVAGGFSTAGGIATNGGYARWNGSSWQALPAGSALLPIAVLDVAVLPNGNLVACGGFVTTASMMPPATNPQMVRVAEWNGTGWQGYGPTIPLNNPPEGPVTRLTAMLDGSVVAGGNFQLIGGISANNVARWDGAVWSALGAGLGTQPQHQLFHLSTLPNGDVMAGGGFDTTPIAPTPAVATINMARLQASACTASVTAYGSGCVGAGGLNILTPDSLPWIGRAMSATTSGIVPGSIALGLWGFTQFSVPLPLVLPMGQAGCSLLVDPTHIDAVVAVGATVQTGIFISNQPSLIGAQLHHQVGLLDFTGGGGSFVLTSTNALTLTIGGY
ncbi:MAG: hypothetical protein ACI91B_003027 [Planctomycetota bacterium]